MKTQIAAVVFAAILPICAQASQPQPIPMIIDCAHPALPSQQDVARFTGIDNFAQAYATRARLLQQTSRECRRGVASVTLVLQPLDSDNGPNRQLASTSSATP
ncbi:MAG: hypothetical protein ABIP56_07440 [Dokdonella sp.]